MLQMVTMLAVVTGRTSTVISELRLLRHLGGALSGHEDKLFGGTGDAVAGIALKPHGASGDLGAGDILGKTRDVGEAVLGGVGVEFALSFRHTDAIVKAS